MKINFGIPFKEFARQNKIPENSEHYASLECIYEEIQQVQEFISYSHQFRPIGRETAKMYFTKLQEIGVSNSEKDQLIGNVNEIQSFVDSQINRAKERESALLVEFKRKIKLVCNVDLE